MTNWWMLLGLMAMWLFILSPIDSVMKPSRIEGVLVSIIAIVLSVVL